MMKTIKKIAIRIAAIYACLLIFDFAFTKIMGQSPDQALTVVVFSNVTAASKLDGCDNKDGYPCIDNRSQFLRQSSVSSYRAIGTGTWSVDMQYSDNTPTNWVSFGSTAQVSNATPPSGIGFGIGPSSIQKPYHDYIRFVITGSATILNYNGTRQFWWLPTVASVAFPITADQGGTVGVFVVDQLYSTLALGCNAAVSGSETLMITQPWTGITTQTFSCNIQVLAGGKIQPASGQTVTLKVMSAPLSTICDMSVGGACNIASATGILYPEWFNSATPIQSAVTSAGSNGWVMIPKSYAGSDIPGCANNIIDLRRNGFGICQYLTTVRPVTDFPLGNDLAFDADGPADLYLVHGDIGSATGTTTTSISAGTQNITLASGSTANFSTMAGVWVGNEQANQEVCTLNSISSPTVMNLTCSQSHSGTTDIQQKGYTILKGQQAIITQPVCPANVPANDHCPVTIGNSNTGAIITLPQDPTDTFPLNTLRVSYPITGATLAGAWSGAPIHADNLVLQNTAGNLIKFLSSTGTTLMEFDDSHAIFAATTTVDIGNTVVTSNATVARTFQFPDGDSQPVISTFVTTTSATSDTFTIQGLTGSSHCSYGAENADAATNITSLFSPATGANSLTLTHAAVAGMVYSVLCTAN